MEIKFENRSMPQDGCNVELNDRTLKGYWAIFNSLSQPLMAERNGKKVIFREIIKPNAFDNAEMRNVKCCLNHDDQNKYLGRVPGTLTISKDDRGMKYECLLPNLDISEEVIEFVNRGDYQGNSFRYFTMAGDDTWEAQPDGSYIRTVNNIRAVQHLGPVFDPAFTETDIQTAMRSMEASGVFTIKETQIEESTICHLKAKRERDIKLKQYSN